MRSLAGMDGAELAKKRSRLLVMEKIEAATELEKTRLVEWLGRAEAIADGNPRLLEWLDLVLCDPLVPIEDWLEKLEGEQGRFRSDVLAEELLGMLVAKGREVLSRGMVFELAVPRAVFEAVCGGAGLERAVDLGLLEVMPNHEVRVSRVLGLVCPEDEQSMNF